jgi:hypothetical protein
MRTLGTGVTATPARGLPTFSTSCIPFTPVMEQWALPNADKIITAFEKMQKMETR